MSRPKKRTESGRLTKEAAEIVIEMLEEGVVQGKLLLFVGCEIYPEFYRDSSSDQYPYRIWGLWYTDILTYYSTHEDFRDIIGFTWKADRKEFERRWNERYPKS